MMVRVVNQCQGGIVVSECPDETILGRINLETFFPLYGFQICVVMGRSEN